MDIWGSSDFEVKDQYGRWKSLETANLDLSNPEVMDFEASDFTKNTEIKISITINSLTADDMGTGHALETAIHELAVHVMQYLSLIEDLRAGRKTGVEFIKAWNDSKKSQKFNNAKKQHADFAKKKNSKYNKILQELLLTLKTKEEKEELRDAAEEDRRNEELKLENE